MIKTLAVKDVYRKCGLEVLFKDTSELKELDGVLIGQERAKTALRYGLSVDKYGYNIFVTGEHSSRKKEYLKSVLTEVAKKRPVPDDLCYVNNFKEETKPILLKFKAGEGETFKEDIEDFASSIKDELIQYFSGNNYNKELELVEQKYELELYNLSKMYEEKIIEANFVLSITKEGYVAIPLNSKGRAMSQKKLNKYIAKNQEKYMEDKNKVNVIILEMIHAESEIQDRKMEEIKEFDKNKALEMISEKIGAIEEKYDNEKILAYIEEIKNYIVENVALFKPMEEIQIVDQSGNIQQAQEDKSAGYEEYTRKLSVNIIVNNKDLENAPVIFAKDLDEYSLFGGMVFDTDNKTMVTKTDFSRIIAGDIARANGGYLVINVDEIIIGDMWNNLKKIMKNKEVKFTSKHLTTVLLSDAIESEPIDIDLKVILVGDEEIHYLLYNNDPDFRELFDVHARFESTYNRNSDSELEYAKLISKYCKENDLRELTYSAVCRVIEHSSRISESQDELVLYYSELYRLLIEADSLAKEDNVKFIGEVHIEQALKNQRDRVDIATERYIEREKKDFYVTTVTGEKVGEINGLAVVDYGEYKIGSVSKITANTYASKGYGVISVDKEADMSGPLHNKCVSIVKGFLGETFAKHEPISLSVNISFEQSYGMIDGDSATLAETCAILSNMSGIPIMQNFAITGSMNQKGEAQIIGGVNEKIEGFFRTCKARNSLNGAGVIIPRANISDLMLSKEVVSAIAEGIFSIYAIDNVKDAIEILTGKTYSEVIERARI